MGYQKIIDTFFFRNLRTNIKSNKPTTILLHHFTLSSKTKFKHQYVLNLIIYVIFYKINVTVFVTA